MFAVHLVNRFIMGTPVQAQPKIELFPGQIVKGTITKAFPGETVQVQIGEASLFARLQAPLEVGQVALFQVLPEGDPLTLKVIGVLEVKGSKAGKAEGDIQALEKLLKGLGIRADRRTLQGLQLLFDSEFPLKLPELPSIVEHLKQADNPGRSVQAIRLAHARHLPITPAVIRSLETFLFGPTLAAILENLTVLEQDLALKAIYREKLLPLVKELKESVSSGKGFNPLPIYQQEASRLQPGFSSGKAPVDPSFVAGTDQDTLPQAPQEYKNVPSPTHGNPTEGENSPTPPVVWKGEKNFYGLRLFLQLLGVEHEAKLLDHFQPNFTDAEEPEVELQNLKHLLLEIRKMDAVSKEVGEWVERGIRWITGQQLLLSSPQESPWNQFLLQIPLSQNAAHEEMAFVQVEGRKNAKGNIDPENCRIYFCLNLKELKETRIDVRILNRVMSVQIYNDLPWVEKWVEAHREEWVKPMEEMGYTLSSLKVLPLPKEPEKRPSAFAFSSYQGVDIRV